MHSKVTLGTHFLAGKADCAQTLASRRLRAGFTGAVERSGAFSRSAAGSLASSNLNRRDHTKTATGSIAVVDGKQRIETPRAVADGLLPSPAVWVDERFQGRTQTVDIDGEAISCVIVDRYDHTFLRVLGDFQLPAVEAKVKTIAEEAELFELINFGGVAQTDADRKRAAEIAGR